MPSDVQKVILDRAYAVAEGQLAMATQFLVKLGVPTNHPDASSLRVAVMQVLATNYAAEVEKRK